MAFFTTTDTNNLKVLIDQHKMIYRRNALLSAAPHIGTHTVLKVKKCTDEYTYKDPVYLPPVDGAQQKARDDLEDLAIIADWTFTETGCDHVVSCNPFHPKSKRCNGMPSYTPHKDRRPQWNDAAAGEAAFSFKTSNGQTFDACQPICYEPAAANLGNMVGLMTRFRFGKCRVYDPMLLALYLDPTRRYINPETQIPERRSFVVKDKLIEPSQDGAVLLASIPNDYCEQYGEAYKSDGHEQGIAMYKCGENPVVWATSWLLGESLPKLATLAYDRVQPYLLGSEHSVEDERRYPPSKSFLVSRESWSNNIDENKRPLPFPLHLSDLGIIRGTATEWMVWTDEFIDANDGRNDKYGGRLVERDRPLPATVNYNYEAVVAETILRNTTAGGLFAPPPVHHQGAAAVNRVGSHDRLGRERHKADGPSRRRRQVESSSSSDGKTRADSAMLKSLLRGVDEYQRVLAKDMASNREHVSLLGLGAGLAYGIGYAQLSHALELPSSISVLKSAFTALRRSPSYARKAALKMVGFWSAKATVAHVTETAVIRCIVKRLKSLAFLQVLGSAALILDVIALVGIAIDITFVLLNAFGVSTPISRRQNPTSDRCLYKLAQTEIEFNHRLYGSANIELTPSKFVVNTPYMNPEEDLQSYMSIMPIVYAARELNSNGGRLKPKLVEDGEFELGEQGEIRYVKNGVHHGTVHNEDELSAMVDERLRQSVKPPTPDWFHDRTTAVSPAPYYMALLFITMFLIGYYYPMRNWAMFVALLVTILSVAFPLGFVVSGLKE